MTRNPDSEMERIVYFLISIHDTDISSKVRWGHLWPLSCWPSQEVKRDSSPRNQDSVTPASVCDLCTFYTLEWIWCTLKHYEWSIVNSRRHIVLLSQIEGLSNMSQNGTEMNLKNKNELTSSERKVNTFYIFRSTDFPICPSLPVVCVFVLQQDYVKNDLTNFYVTWWKDRAH